MKKNIFLSTALFLVSFVAITPLLSMDTPKKSSSDDEPPMPNLFEQSMVISKPTIGGTVTPIAAEDLNRSIIPPAPTKQGLGVMSWLRDKKLGEEKNLLLILQNGTFDPNNISCLHKVSKAFEIYSTTRPNDEELTQILALLATNYSGEIKFDRVPATFAHTFLTKTNQGKKKALKEQLTQEDQAFLEDINSGLLKLQESFQTQLTALQEKSDNYFTNRKDIVEEKCKDIRRIKTGLIHIHNLTLNAAKVLKQDGYCSDDETKPENIPNSYDNQFILKQIKADEQMNNTEINTKQLLGVLLNIYTSLIRLHQIKIAHQ